MSQTRDADVVVVGAGPAGSATAYHLASTGLDVALLEKTAFPREKVCGDGLTPRAAFFVWPTFSLNLTRI